MAYDEFDAEEQEAPGFVLFGITLSPPVLAMLLAAAGLGLSVWLGLNYVKPAMEKSATLNEEIKSLNDKLARQSEIEEQIEDAQAKLDEAKLVQGDVQQMFSNPNNLDTLLLDLNQQIERRNPQLTADVIRSQLQERGCPAYVVNNYPQIEDRAEGFFAQSKLTKFEPQVPQTSASDGYELVNDGSLGVNANNQVKRQVYNVELEGNFDRARLILIQLEKLQPLLRVVNMKAEVSSPAVLLTSQGPLSTCQPETKLTMSFQLQALLPLTQEELEAMMAPPAEGEGEEEQN
ncbi:hypothetical protein IQ235_05095 [Oscillatoriales cyanobacterium LEGE 11467]|uniref:Type IV pilus assembly protein PilO n=1 Tax=Zarconia navalis LEGE 11467 TaxID=1828826 RepID=A0A928VTV5_9CYAN|nr:hypothetical protein [Zarconia navalis]MBE9040167.1 hypothetical protein [Zarconia navalis LEGE 11467]